MVTVAYAELSDAFDFANATGPIRAYAFVDLDTGAFHTYSDDYVPDELPEDLQTSDRYLALPDKRDLDLGRTLVLSFIDRQLPEEYDKVADFFHKRGAYGRFKDLLNRRDLVDDWHAFEAAAVEAALRQWCEEHGLQVSSS